MRRSLSRRRFCASLQRLVPELVEADLVPGRAGVRAQAVRPDGELVQDRRRPRHWRSEMSSPAASSACSRREANLPQAGMMILVTGGAAHDR